MLLLAGDVGGTKTMLGLFAAESRRPEPVTFRTFPTLQYESVGAMVDEFLREWRANVTATGSTFGPIASGCLGVAGPVRGQTAKLTNIPWTVDADEVAAHLGRAPVALVNDLVAMAYAVPVLRPSELTMLQTGAPDPSGNAVLIAPGTGLGQALLHKVGAHYVPAPSEGGHSDFAARTPREVNLLNYLTSVYGRAEVEHILSGPGIVNLFQFIHEKPCPAVDTSAGPSAIPALVTAAALEGRCDSCAEALELFVTICGSEAGNIALRFMATAGVYLGGGIPPKILPALRTPAFLDAFRAKAPMTDLLAAMPVGVITHDHPGLLGAAVHARNINVNEAR